MLAMPRVMISGFTRKTPTPMPLIRPTTRPTEHGDRQRRRRAARVLAGHHVRRRGGGGGHRQVDARGQHHQRLAGGDDPERRRDRQVRAEARGRKEARETISHAISSSTRITPSMTSGRSITHSPGGGGAVRPRLDGLVRRGGRRAHRRSPQQQQAADHDDDDDQRALDHLAVVRIDPLEEHDRGHEREHERGDDRAEQPARCRPRGSRRRARRPRRVQGVVAGVRRADPGRRGQRQSGPARRRSRRSRRPAPCDVTFDARQIRAFAVEPIAKNAKPVRAPADGQPRPPTGSRSR